MEDAHVRRDVDMRPGVALSRHRSHATTAARHATMRIAFSSNDDHRPSAQQAVVRRGLTARNACCSCTVARLLVFDVEVLAPRVADMVTEEGVNPRLP